MLKYLLDTNIIIYTMKRRPAKVQARFEKHDGQMAMSTVTFGELVFGCERSSNPKQNLLVLESFASRVTVLDFDRESAAHFGELRASLYSKGTPIGPYDMMIAAQARARGLVLVTNNQKEFRRLPGVRLENWVRG
ncbi:MAG: type II toxin-antitoxin system VapC family toxin [Myxococcota bacterium]